ncbi:MAG TPA: carboxypeptidase-like regulatory domain-containing protein, partial [Candidatus Acidoferrum sp.]|nr:carboxypeptidase-like regulatory domain-containing protein [Candidatus Acidoferrum sp.]
MKSASGGTVTLLSCTRLMLSLFSVAALTCAQISNGSFLGTVSDPSGAVVGGATVVVQNTGTQLTRSVMTNANGEYVVPDLPAAHYSIKVTASGFKTFTIPDVELQVAQRAMVDATLQIGGVEQEVTVAAAPPMVQTSESSVGQVV